MNEIKIFENQEFGSVRTIAINGEPWFVGKDVATALGYTDLSHSITDHVDEEDRCNSKTRGQNDPEFGQRGTWLINESGVYALVFGSKLESAKRFKHWVTSEVLPSIRKTGTYNLPQTYAEALRALADKAEEAENLEKENTVLLTDNQRMRPKEEFFDAVTGSPDAIDMKDCANALHMGIGRNNLFKFLREQKILTHTNRPYQQYIDSGYFRVIEQKYDKGFGETGINIKTVVFQKGVDFIRKKLLEYRNNCQEKEVNGDDSDSTDA